MTSPKPRDRADLARAQESAGASVPRRLGWLRLVELPHLLRQSAELIGFTLQLKRQRLAR